MRTAKAWVAGGLTLLTALGVVLMDDVIVNEEITDLVSITIGVGLSLWGVYQTRNAPEETAQVPYARTQ